MEKNDAETKRRRINNDIDQVTEMVMSYRDKARGNGNFFSVLHGFFARTTWWGPNKKV